MRHADVSLAVLAGGKGTRLGGVAKGTVPFRGAPLLTRVLRHAPSFAETLLVTSDPAPYAAFEGLRTVPDLLLGRGAPGGVHAALAAAATPWVLVLACDMPLVRAEALALLLSERGRGGEWDVLCFEVQGRLEPLLGLYRAALAPAWEEALGEGASFRALFPHFRARVLPEARLREVDPPACSTVSVNTPEDLARWEGDLRCS